MNLPIPVGAKGLTVKQRVAAGVALVAATLLIIGACSDTDTGPGPQEEPGPQEDAGPTDGTETITGSGTVVVESRDVAGFERIDLAGEGT